MKMQIKDLKPYENGWEWILHVEGVDEDDGEEFVSEVHYRTNAHSEGLFTYTSDGGLRQIEGTCDWGLYQKTLSGVRRGIKRYFEKWFGEDAE